MNCDVLLLQFKNAERKLPKMTQYVYKTFNDVYFFE